MNSEQKLSKEVVKILIAEDSPTQAVELQHILEKRSYQVFVAVNGREALGLAKQNKPTIVVTDIIMPEMDGYQLCEAIKADEDLESIPVIMLTVLSDVEDVVKALNCGADSFITKPYNNQYLTSNIEDILANSRLPEDGHKHISVDIHVCGQKYTIVSEHLSTLRLLLSTYAVAVQKNQELERAEEDLLNLNRELEKKIGERTIDLQRRVQELQGLNSMFHKHLSVRSETELAYVSLTMSISQLDREIDRLQKETKTPDVVSQAKLLDGISRISTELKALLHGTQTIISRMKLPPAERT